MNWTAAIDRNREALITIIAMLAAMAGFVPGAAAVRIERSLRLDVLRMLRPAEAAVRRLIFVAARTLALKPSVARPFPAGGIPLPKAGKVRARRPLFGLTDRLVPMTNARNRDHAKQGPRIRGVAPFDPTIAGYLADRATSMAHEISLVDQGSNHGNASPLLRRIEAITAALDDIPAQAKRLQRWMARQSLRAQTQPVHTVPLKPGPPPGLRHEALHDIDRILLDCHVLAHEVRLNSS
jgi:hypothetical protein